MNNYTIVAFFLILVWIGHVTIQSARLVATLIATKQTSGYTPESGVIIVHWALLLGAVGFLIVGLV